MGAATYDNGAFLFFVLSVLVVYLVPASLVSARSVWRAYSKRRADVRSGERVSGPLLSRCFQVHLCSLAAGWLCVLFIAYSLGDGAQIAKFDPFAVLGLRPGATDREIKRAYRSLSLELHPDKNPNNPLAAQRFMAIAKAYEALTDETARSNFEKYGNPDGPQPMEVGIGLPALLMDGDNQKRVLLAYMSLFLLAVPFFVWRWVRKSSKYLENGLLESTARNVSQGIVSVFYAPPSRPGAPPTPIASPQPLNLRMLTMMWARAEEPKLALGVTKEDLADADRVASEYAAMAGKINVPEHLKDNQDVLSSLATDMAIIAHYQRDAKLTARMIKRRDIILSLQPKVLSVMLETLVGVKRVALPTVTALLSFSQCARQACAPSQQLMQIPNLTLEMADRLVKREQPVKEVRQLLSMPADAALEVLATVGYDVAANVRAFRKFHESMPLRETTVTPVVEGEDKIAEDDLVTVKVAVRRTNGPCPRYAHAPLMPVSVHETLYVMLLSNPTNIIGFAPISVRNGQAQEDSSIRFRAPPPGKYSFAAFVISDTYIGLDQRIMVGFEVVPRSAVEPLPQVHDEDVRLDEQPSLMSQVMGGPGAEPDTDDESGSDGEGAGGAGAAGGHGHSHGGVPCHGHGAAAPSSSSSAAAAAVAAAAAAATSAKGKPQQQQARTASSAASGAPATAPASSGVRQRVATVKDGSSDSE